MNSATSLKKFPRIGVTSILVGVLLTAGLSIAARRQGTAQPTAAPDAAAQRAASLKLFDTQVRRILMDNCVECHGSKEREAEFSVTTREGLLKGGMTGEAVVAGSADESWLVYLIRHEEEPYMPEDTDDQLSDEDIEHIADWIDTGAHYSASLPDKPKPEPPARSRN